MKIVNFLYKFLKINKIKKKLLQAKYGVRTYYV